MTHAVGLLLAGVPGGWELWIILLIILILFGSRLPKIARSMGQGISEFKRGLSERPDEPPATKSNDDAPLNPPKS